MHKMPCPNPSNLNWPVPTSSSYIAAKRGSAFVRLSLQAIKEWRVGHPELYPPTPHVWSTSENGSNAPVAVCYVCTKPIAGSQWQVGCL